MYSCQQIAVCFHYNFRTESPANYDSELKSNCSFEKKQIPQSHYRSLPLTVVYVELDGFLTECACFRW